MICKYIWEVLTTGHIMVAAVVGQDEICRSQAHVMIPHYVWIQVVHVNLKEENKNKQKNKFEET